MPKNTLGQLNILRDNTTNFLPHMIQSYIAPQRQVRVKEYECQSNQLVYKLYNLTKKEIKIIEGTLQRRIGYKDCERRKYFGASKI